MTMISHTQITSNADKDTEENIMWEMITEKKEYKVKRDIPHQK